METFSSLVPRLFVSNFDFEYELTDTTAAAQPATAADRSFVWLAIGETGDALRQPDGRIVPFETLLAANPELQARRARLSAISPHLPLGSAPPTNSASPADNMCAGNSAQELTLVPWGWSAPARHLVAANQPIPSLEAVQRVNRRSFRAQLEIDLGLAVPGLAVCRSRDEVITALTKLPKESSRWVLKAEYGMAGREAFRGQGRQLTSQVSGWIQRRLAADRPLIFEPWLPSLGEAGLQWEIPPIGQPQLLGITPLLSDRAGTYRGSLIGELPGPDEWQAAVPAAYEVARRVQQSGYFGPLGIDVMRYADPASSGRSRLRILQDLNARYTMGRLALGWLRDLLPGECAAWLHPSPKFTAEELQQRLDRTVGHLGSRGVLIPLRSSPLGSPQSLGATAESLGATAEMYSSQQCAAATPHSTTALLSPKPLNSGTPQSTSSSLLVIAPEYTLLKQAIADFL